jgi:hypothetical protein
MGIAETEQDEEQSSEGEEEESVSQHKPKINNIPGRSLRAGGGIF